MNLPKNIIWDWNGTLLDDVPIACHVVNTMLKERHLSELSIDKYRQIYRHPIKEIYRELGFDFSKESFEELSDIWHKRYHNELGNIPLFDDAIPALTLFKEKGIIQTVLSAHPHSLLVNAIKNFNLNSYFRQISGLDHNRACSKIENGLTLTKELNFKPEETIIIGDSKHDVETAEALGVECILIARGFESKERLLSYKVQVLNSIQDLYNKFI